MSFTIAFYRYAEVTKGIEEKINDRNRAKSYSFPFDFLEIDKASVNTKSEDL